MFLWSQSAPTLHHASRSLALPNCPTRQPSISLLCNTMVCLMYRLNMQFVVIKNGGGSAGHASCKSSCLPASDHVVVSPVAAYAGRGGSDLAPTSSHGCMPARWHTDVHARDERLVALAIEDRIDARWKGNRAMAGEHGRAPHGAAHRMYGARPV
jgi:hypothetical protein